MAENQNHAGNRDLFLKELYEERIWEDLDYIKFLNSESKVFQELRENHQEDWEIVELCREALFDNAKQIAFLRRRVEDEGAQIRKLR